MKQISIRELLDANNQSLIGKYPQFIQKIIIYSIEKLLKINEINKFISLAKDKTGVDFIDLLFEKLGVEINYEKDFLDKIPAETSLIIIANHPTGGLDGLALLSVIHKKRPDIKVVANDLLSNINNLREMFLPVDLYSTSNQRENISAIMQHIRSGNSVLFFPAAKVSRKINGQIRDLEWTLGAFKMARKLSTQILPVYINAKNSRLFYLSLKLKDSLAPLLLPREMFGQKGKTIELIPRKIITKEIFRDINRDEDVGEMVRNYLYDTHHISPTLSKYLKGQ